MNRPTQWAAAAAVAATLLVGLADGISGAPNPTPTPGHLTGPITYTSPTTALGTLQYWVYLPLGYHAGGAAMPLIVELHGCAPDNAVSEARWSRLDALADRQGFIVVYPQQNAAANGSGCWNWFEPADTTRAPGTPVNPTTQSCNCSDTGEPSLIAGVTTTVRSTYGADPRRVFVGGISAGGAMANIMAVTFPDLYAAALVYAGCDYMATPNCLGTVSALPGNVSGQDAYNEMTANHVARVVPVIVVQGDADPVVPFPNSTLVLEQWLTTDALVADPAFNALAAIAPPTATRTAMTTNIPPQQSYQVEEYADPANAGCLLATRWLIHGMAHQWSGVTPDPAASTYSSDLIFNDPNGPDVTTPIYQFLMSHAMPLSGKGCVQGAAPALVSVTNVVGSDLPNTSR